MQLLVTGGAGFIGAHLVRHWLAAHPGDRVVNLDALTYAGSPGRLADLAHEPRYRFVQGDICAPDAVQAALEGCEAVIHCAAETHVDRSITDPRPFVRTNVEGTAVLMAAARAAGLRRVLHVSTDEVYGPVPEGAVDEAAPLAPRSPYAASKAAGDLYAQACAHTYGLPVIVARPTNIYGPGQLPEKFLALCITQGLQRQPIPVYGDGQQRRAWLHVADACRALALLLEQGAAGGVYNIAGGAEAGNLDVAQRVLARVEAPSTLLRHVADRPGHDRRYAMRDQRLRALGWQPQIGFDQGLEETIAWYRAQEAWWRPLVSRLREDPYHWLDRPAGAGAGGPVGPAR